MSNSIQTIQSEKFIQPIRIYEIQKSWCRMGSYYPEYYRDLGCTTLMLTNTKSQDESRTYYPRPIGYNNKMEKKVEGSIGALPSIEERRQKRKLGKNTENGGCKTRGDTARQPSSTQVSDAVDKAVSRTPVAYRNTTRISFHPLESDSVVGPKTTGQGVRPVWMIRLFIHN